MKILRYVLYSLLFLVVFVAIFALAVIYTDSWVNQFEEEMAIEVEHIALDSADVTAAPNPDTLRVMTYNIKFGGARVDFFFDCYGDRVHMQRKEVEQNLQAVAEKIRQYRPHVLLLQEVDIESDRSADVNQLMYLMKRLQMPYGVYASQWDVQYIPTEGLGKVNSGNAILSRYPIDNATRYALDQMQEQDAVTRFFYLRRNLLRAEIHLGEKGPLAVYNTHLSAYSKDGTRKQQLDEVQQLLHKETLPFVFGGDLNTLPPGTQKHKDFEDSVCDDDDFVMDDYAKELQYLTPFYNKYNEAIPLKDYQANEAQYYSHTVNGRGWRATDPASMDNSFWNRRLDYIFSPLDLVNGTVHQDTSTGMATMPLSDHAPVTAELLVNPEANTPPTGALPAEPAAANTAE